MLAYSQLVGKSARPSIRRELDLYSFARPEKFSFRRRTAAAAAAAFLLWGLIGLSTWWVFA